MMVVKGVCVCVCIPSPQRGNRGAFPTVAGHCERSAESEIAVGIARDGQSRSESPRNAPQRAVMRLPPAAMRTQMFARMAAPAATFVGRHLPGTALRERERERERERDERERERR